MASIRDEMVRSVLAPTTEHQQAHHYLEEVAPCLCEMLTTVPHDAPEAKTATLWVLEDEGRVKVCVHDRALQRKLWITVGDINSEFWSLLEAAVTSPTADWRKSWDDNGRKRK